jgi:hypothetical protein
LSRSWFGKSPTANLASYQTCQICSDEQFSFEKLAAQHLPHLKLARADFTSFEKLSENSKDFRSKLIRTY